MKLENVLINDKGSLKVSDFGLSALPHHSGYLRYSKVVTNSMTRTPGDYYGTWIRETRIKSAPVHASADWYLKNSKKLALAKYRQVIWQGRVLKTQFSDEELRNQGRCPLTPEEIELLLLIMLFCWRNGAAAYVYTLQLEAQWRLLRSAT
ncbi:O-fucosyltransferase 31 [Bienertia sinuspersici]